VKPPRCGDVVEVAWVDSEHIELGWAPVSDYRKAARRNPEAYRTSGYWMDRVKGRVVIAQSLSLYNRHTTHIMSIPEVAVTDMRVLGRSNKRVRKALR
jgi:hypothetical protein